jgi:hypothetical protein
VNCFAGQKAAEPLGAGWSAADEGTGIAGHLGTFGILSFLFPVVTKSRACRN